MNAITIKNKLSELYYKSLFVDCDINSHPVILINSVKSIIGIDFKISQDKLIDYCINYMDDCKYVDSFGVLESKSTPAAVSFATLEESLINGNFNESLMNIDSLLKVSDGKHILEFLLEFCIKYKNDALQLIWSIYKMSLFLDFLNINENIILCIKNISKCKNTPLSKSKKNLDIDFNKYSYSKDSLCKILTYYAILDEKLVRKEKIKKYIKLNTENQFDFSASNNNLIIKTDQIEFGRKWIAMYLNNIDKSCLSPDLILIMDMFRSSIKISNGKHDKLIWNLLNIYLDK